MIGLNDYIEYAKAHGRESAKFLTTFEGKYIYVGIYQLSVLMCESINEALRPSYVRICLKKSDCFLNKNVVEFVLEF